MSFLNFLLSLIFISTSFADESITDFSQIKELNSEELVELVDSLEYSDDNKNFIYATAENLKVSDLTADGSMPSFTHSVFDHEQASFINTKVTLSDAQLAFVKSNLLKAYNESYDLEISAENVTSVGDYDLDASIVLFKSELVALKLNMFQAGAYHEEKSYGPHFDTEEEALSQGWDTGADVSWSTHATLDYNGEVIYSHYWEWTGW